MALLGYEGFDNIESAIKTSSAFNNMPFGTSGSYNGRWGYPGASQAQKTPGLLGGYGIEPNTFSGNVVLDLFTTYSTIIVGFRWRAPAHIFATPIIQFVDAVLLTNTRTNQCGLSLDGLGRVYFWTGTESNVLTTGSTILVGGGWYFIDVTVTINNSTGAYTVNLGGVQEFTATGKDTQTTANAYTNEINLTVTAGVEYQTAFDDFYACDTTGPAPYNAPLGVIRVETLYPTSNVSVTWTPLANTNWQEVSEVNMDGDTSYNSQATTGIDTFGHGALSSTPTAVFAVDVVSAARKTDVIAINYRNTLISGGTTSNGSDSTLGTVYVYVRDSYLTDPDTGLAWTATAINATTFGYERH